MVTHSGILVWRIPVDRGAWRATIHEVARESDTTGCLTLDVQTACPLCCKLVSSLGFPGGSDGKESTCNAGNLGLVPELGRSPWRRAWQPTPVFLPGESPWTEEPGRLQPMGFQRVGHD